MWIMWWSSQLWKELVLWVFIAMYVRLWATSWSISFSTGVSSMFGSLLSLGIVGLAQVRSISGLFFNGFVNDVIEVGIAGVVLEDIMEGVKGEMFEDNSLLGFIIDWRSLSRVQLKSKVFVGDVRARNCRSRHCLRSS